MNIGKIKIGKGQPIAIQSMTNTDTADAKATAEQGMELADAGAEIVRITIDNDNSAKAVPQIRKILDENNYSNLPLIGDFHFNGHELLESNPITAKILDKYRINPGNERNFEKMIKLAVKNKKPVRIGVNSGSTDNDLVKTAINSAKKAEDLGLTQSQIVLSVKTSKIKDLIKYNEQLAKHPYAIHLGLTEAGKGVEGIVHSTAALAILLNKGIGDTIRVSITPEKSRTEEVKVAKEILQSLDLRNFKPRIISCPGCGRTDNELFQKLTKEITHFIENKSQDWQRTHSNLKIAIMGCVVNGPGESKNADIALHLPGKSEQKIAQVYLDGKKHKILTGENISKDFIEIINSSTYL